MTDKLQLSEENVEIIPADVEIPQPRTEEAMVALNKMWHRLSTKTARVYRAHLKGCARFFGYGENIEVAMGHLLAADRVQALHALEVWRDTIKHELAPATVNARLTAVRTFLREANRLGFIGWEVDVDGLDSQSYRDTRGPGHDGYRKMLEALDGDDAKTMRDRAIIRLLYERGLRRNEVATLDLKHYDESRPAVHVLGKKKKERVWLTVSSTSAKAVDQWLEVRPEVDGVTSLFVTLPVVPGQKPKPIDGSAIYRLVRAAGEAADIGKVRPHGLRHAAITRVLDKRGVREAQKFSRHAKLDTLMIYDDNREDIGGEMAEMLGAETEGGQ